MAKTSTQEGTIYIRPFPKTISFLRGAKSVQEVRGTNGQKVRREKEFNSAFLPGSIQELSALYLKGQYTWQGTDEELQQFVDRLQLKYPAGHQLEGQTITKASRVTYPDPFFEHKVLRKRQSEGYLELNPDNVIDQFLIRVAKAHPDFKDSFSDDERAPGEDPKFVITNKNITAKKQSDTKNNTRKATQLYENLSQDKKIAICRILGLIVGNDYDLEDVDNHLYVDYVLENKKKVGRSDKTNQEVFIDLCEMKPEAIHIQDLIARARSQGILRFNQKDGWMFNGSKIGPNKKSVLNFFKEPSNVQALEQLEAALSL